MLINKNTYIILQYSGEPSGAEKRFIDIWKYLINKNYPVFLVTHKKISEFYTFSNSEKKFLLLFNSNKTTFLSQYFTILRFKNNIERNSIIHFVNTYYPLLSFLTNSKFIISCLQPFNIFSMKYLKFRHCILFLLGFFFSKTIDVLIPKNYYFYKKLFYFKKIYITPTSNSVDENIFSPSSKKNSIVFLGRLEKHKGINNIIEIITSLEKKLFNNNFSDKIFLYILGSGSEQNKINNFIKKNYFKNIIVQNFYSKNPNLILNKSKIFLSLQSSSNYPSRSLIEAMYSGCIPIITDVGDSRMMGSSKYLFYVDRKINSQKITDLIYNIILYDNIKFTNISKHIRHDAILLFQNKNQSKYFEKLYFKQNI